ncbi:hypothetical protein MNB_SV-6-552 [hydrothermal vent metagenome]|uniref:Card1 endonuclease domain-containing protein n=1 Tax=hydrothermal vent metagenome TaxID=652676 RepID=A0A1W1CB91_9ZZZZ
MSIFKCSKCAYIKEVADKYVGKRAKCPKCGNEAKVVDTIPFVDRLTTAYTKQKEDISTYKANMQKVKEYIEKQKSTHQEQLHKHQQEVEKLKKQNSSLNSKYSKSINQHNKDQEKIKTLQSEVSELQHKLTDSNKSVENISHNQEFNLQDDYRPIIDWFAQKHIEVMIDKDAVDTRGFFDEVAITLGNNYSVLEGVLEQMRYIHRKGYDTVKISLENRSKEDISIIKNFCKEIYDYSFASRYYHDKKKNAIYLEIQKATKIANFFNGIWMEWYVYMMLLERFEKQELSYTLVKGIEIIYPNKDKNELDIFFIVDGTPVCIECKSGEFRKDIDKYVKLRKRLKLNREHFIICAIGLDEIQTDGLSNTFDITFTNQNNLLEYIDTILANIEEHNKKVLNIKNSFSKQTKTETTSKGTKKAKSKTTLESSQDITKDEADTIKKSGFLKSIISPFSR